MKHEFAADPRDYQIADLRARVTQLEADVAGYRALAKSAEATRNQAFDDLAKLRAAIGPAAVTRAVIDIELAERNIAALHTSIQEMPA
jgi:uncharacterized protein YlxW (UPF0749 family)